MATILDGSVLEGGGQLVRNAVTFSALLERPVVVSKLRSGRSTPGLRPQHITGINLVAEICGGHVSGATLGSSEISFNPGSLVHGSYVADTSTAGSTALLMQVALPCLLFADSSSELRLRGGTNAAAAPQIDYTAQVFLPFLARHMHLTPEMTIKRRGYYPRGGGEVVLRTTPLSPGEYIPAVTLTTRGKVTAVHGRTFVAGTLPLHIADRMTRAATSTLVASGVHRTLIDVQVVRESPNEAVGNGSGIVLWAETENGCIIGGSAVGKKGTDAAKTGVSAADELTHNLQHGGCVDEYMQDQIIIFLALAKGKSAVMTGPLTLHTRTAIWLAEQLTDAKFSIEQDEVASQILITCQGVGLIRPHK